MSKGRALYRQILRQAGRLPAPVHRKVQLNTREAFCVHADQGDAGRIAELHEDAAAAARVLAWLSGLPEVGSLA